MHDSTGNAARAVATFKEGFNCSQSLLATFADQFKLDAELAFKLANGFGGGMGRKQEVCGAVSGAIMVLGLKYGRKLNEPKEKQELLYAKVQQLINGFNAAEGSINCRTLLDGCNLLSPEGQAMFKEKNLGITCQRCIATATTLVDSLL